MTAQVGDKIRNLDNGFNVLALSNPIDFSPEVFGIIPGVLTTACWRGFWCDYEIKDGQFSLKTLYVNSKDNNYPVINGVSPLLEPYPEAKMLNYMGHHIYKDINVPIKYTGKIIAVDGLIMDYIGVERMRCFENVIERTFKDGRCEAAIDLSNVVAEFRTELHNEIEKKNIDNIFTRVDAKKFNSLMNSCDFWWIDLV